MKNKILKYSIRLLFMVLASTSISSSSLKAQMDNEKLVLTAQLINKVGLERTRLFIKNLEQKNTIPTRVQTVVNTVKTAVNKPTAPKVTAQHHVSTHNKTVIIPQATAHMNRQELEQYKTVITNLDQYMLKVYGCIERFLSKNNSAPYKAHVGDFKKELEFLKTNVVNQMPQGDTATGKKVFGALKEVAKSLESSQSMMCQTLDRNYTTAWIPAKALGDELDKLTPPVNKLRAHIDMQVGVLRNELRHNGQQELLHRLNKLYQLINKTFDYGNAKSRFELAGVLMHRLKR